MRRCRSGCGWGIHPATTTLWWSTRFGCGPIPRRDGRSRRNAANVTSGTEAKLQALERRVRSGRLSDPAKIGAAAQRILAPSGVGRLFDLEIAQGRFLYHYNEDAHAYEELLAGRYVPATSLTADQADTAQVVGYYHQLQAVEARFRVIGDFLRLRPIRHWTEQRVRGHVAVCVYAAVIETLISHTLVAADIRDPDLGDQHLTPSRALRDLNRIRRHELTTNNRRIHLTTRPNPQQHRTLTALGADTRNWNWSCPAFVDSSRFCFPQCGL